jgi:crotonobetainyl-CoA:carnitine CoA-transferase CaiB-like acyl-CoA transferase
VWFGGKGMYPKLLEVLGDEPSAEGYYTDQAKGALNERAIRWRSFFAEQPRDIWIERLRAAGIPCEPVFTPGEALGDDHLAAIGLAVPREDHGHRDVVVGAPIAVVPLGPGAPAAETDARPATGEGADLLAGLRVLDFSAFVAGPLGAQVLADLGAEVIKVEPPAGEAMRAAAYAVAACQRGKRSIALDINAREARPVVERLIGWADVVMHNFRVGVSERLGIDEQSVARLNPRAVYCHASGFGTSGPRATFPSNDALMQAVTGLERAVGGVGNDPLAPTWIPIDMAGGWVTAAGILAGLYARARGNGGQQVATSLLGAGMLLQSGVFQRDGQCVRGPALDARQTGYGPGYRIYEGADGNWFALVLPDDASWTRVRSLPEASSLPARYRPLRGTDVGAAEEAEAILERAFASAPASEWVARLRTLDLLVEPIPPMSRDDFRRRILDDPLNRQLGRVVAYETEAWGHFEQIGPLLRCGPRGGEGPRLMLPGIGEHTQEVLAELGCDEAEIEALLASGVARAL